jgi:hypothetical protein
MHILARQAPTRAQVSMTLVCVAKEVLPKEVLP